MEFAGNFVGVRSRISENLFPYVLQYFIGLYLDLSAQLSRGYRITPSVPGTSKTVNGMNNYLQNLLCGFRTLFAEFRSDTRGAVAAFVAGGIISMVGVVGLATDAARGYMVKARLGQALDAAALAGGREIYSPTRDADIQMFFNANFPPGFLGATRHRPCHPGIGQ